MTPRAAASRLLLVAAACCVLAGASSGGSGVEPSVPDPTPPKLSEAQRIRALPEDDARWLTEFAAPILLPEERKVFLELTESYQREVFKADFWARRENPGLPPPLGPGYRDRYAELRRAVDEKYDGWRQDAGRMVLRWGEPDSLLKPSCAGEEIFRDLEVWTYHQVGIVGRGTVRHIFYRPLSARAPRRIWTLNDGEDAPFVTNRCNIQKLSHLAADCSGRGDIRCGICEERCEVYKAFLEIQARQGSGAGATMEYANVFRPVPISTEGLDGQKARWATTSDPAAKPIQVEGPSTSGSAPATALAERASRSGTPTPAPTPADLSREEIEARILRLEPKYREWLDLARPLLTHAEVSRFLQMPSGEKDRFMREFWKKHS